MGNKYWDQRDSTEEMDRHIKMLKEAEEFQEKRKKEDKERIKNIKHCLVNYDEVSREDVAWLIMKLEKGLG